jgi:hypothetical protein
MNKTESRKGVSRRSLILLVVATVLGLIHHADHVLRVDHSGWPFQADVSPFTYSLLVYPVVLFVFLARSRPLLGAGALALTLVALQAAHLFAETPADQYGVWAHNASSQPDALGQPNLLGLESQALEVLATGLSILLSVFVLAAAMSLVADAWRSRATLRPGAAGGSSANG